MRTALLATALLALAPSFPARSPAQNPALDGHYVLVSQGGADINRAIDAAIRRMSFVTRPIARGRLRRTNIPYARLDLSITPSQISNVVDGGKPVVTPANGTIVKWVREDGEQLDVSTEWRGESLIQTFRADDGQRENHYTLGADGRTLTLGVTVTSPRLPAPLTYTLTYRKE